jgi:hypothetical protein
VQDLRDRTGWADWVPLNREAVQINSVVEATANLATGYDRPEDLEIGTSTGDDKRATTFCMQSLRAKIELLRSTSGPAAGLGRHA